MKKKRWILIIVFLLFVISITISLYINNSANNKSKLKESFLKWENGEVSSEQEKLNIINRLNKYLYKHSDISNEEIYDICDSFKIFEKNKLRILQYSENILFYGSSAKSSFQIAMYDNNVKTIINNGTIYINEVRQVDDSTYYIYGSNYQFSNLAGVIILRLYIQNNVIELTKNVISKDNLPSEFSFELANASSAGPYDYVETLYYKNANSFYFNDISEDGSHITCTIGDIEHYFILENDGLYHYQAN